MAGIDCGHVAEVNVQPHLLALFLVKRWRKKVGEVEALVDGWMDGCWCAAVDLLSKVIFIIYINKSLPSVSQHRLLQPTQHISSPPITPRPPCTGTGWAAASQHLTPPTAEAIKSLTWMQPRESRERLQSNRARLCRNRGGREGGKSQGREERKNGW